MKVEKGQRIIVRIGRDGSMTVETKGFKGASCKEATEFLEKLMVVEETKETAEMWDRECETQVVTKR
jgi:hypothetical protein